MSRMIDADALREQLVWCKEQAGRFDTYWDDVIERLDSLPTVDAAPVVRCRDCKWWNDYRCQNDEVLYQIDDCGCHPTFYVDYDWFCPKAERKEEKKNADD